MDSRILEYFYIAVTASVPMLFGTVGEILTEKVGNLNLGVEGMMLMGAFGGFFASYATLNPLIGMLSAAAFGALGALIYAFLTVTLRANQTVTGLCLSIFGAGFTKFMGNSLADSIIKANRASGSAYVSIPKSVTDFFAPVKIPLLSDIPVIGRIFFQYSLYVYLAFAIAILMHFYLNKTRIGLNVRAVGENPAAADAAGINVTLYKYVNIVAGGAICGLGGGYLSTVFQKTWTENVVSGLGWISVALVIFASWRPLRAIFGSLIFGGLKILGTLLQDAQIQKFIGIKISPYLLDLLPFLVTILVLVITSIRMSKENREPQGIGINYFREER